MFVTSSSLVVVGEVRDWRWSPEKKRDYGCGRRREDGRIGRRRGVAGEEEKGCLYITSRVWEILDMTGKFN